MRRQTGNAAAARVSFPAPLDLESRVEPWDGPLAGRPEEALARLERLAVDGRPLFLRAWEGPLAQELWVAQAAHLAEVSGGGVHVLRLSTARGVELVRRAKSQGVALTASVTPLHLLLTREDAALEGFAASPPLGTEEDARALGEGLADGTLDAVGWGGLPVEAVLALVVTHFVRPGLLDLAEAAARLASAPAALLSSPDPEPALVLDLEASWRLAGPPPFEGWTVYGRATPA